MTSRQNTICPWNDREFTCRSVSYPHYLIPEQNLHSSVSFDCDGNNWYREPFPYNCSYHLPFLPPNKISNMKLQEGDPISSLVSKKLQWQAQMNLVEKNYKKIKMNFDTVDEAISSKLNRMKVGRHEGYILHLFNHDPDPNFSGLTNWWYAGGRVGHMLIGGQMALLTSSGEENEKLYVVPISDESKSWQPIISDAMEFPTSSNETICQITCTSRKSGRHNLVGVRQRNTCMILSLQLTSNSFEQREDKCWEVTYDEAPFTSLDFNPYKFSTFCTSSIDRQVSLWDSKKCCCVSTQLVQKPDQNLPTSWSSLQYIDANTIVLSDPSTLMLLDLRQAFEKPSLVYCPHDQKGLVKSCEDISLTFRSSNISSSGRHFYCGTSHHAFMFDVRCSKAVQLWTHMMRSPPMYGHSVTMGTTDTTELVCIANQEPADMQLIVNNWCQSDEMARSAVLPYAGPSLICSRNAAQTSGHLLDPRAHSRMKMSLAGITCLPANSTTIHSIVTQTSAGDVFVQELRELGGNITYTKADLDKFQIWERHVLKMTSATKLKLSSQHQYGMVVQGISDPTLQLPRYKKKIRLQESLKSSTAELLSYKDILAAKLLEAWDIIQPENDDHNNSLNGMLPCNGDFSSQDSQSQSNTLGCNDQSPDNSIAEGMQMNSLKKKRKRSDDVQQEIVDIEPRKKKKKKDRPIDETSSVSGF